MRLSCVTFLALFVMACCLAPSRRADAAPEGIPCPPEPTDATIAYGDVITCQIESAGDSDIFRFAGTATEIVMIFAIGGTRPCIELVSPDGARQEACDVGGQNRIDAVLNQTGSYAIRVTGIFVDSYVLVTERVVPPSRDRVAIRYGDLSQSDLDPAGEFDLFAFRGSAGDTITIDAEGGVRPCIELIAPDNARTTACSTSPTQRIDAVLTHDGTYSVLYSGIFGGAYDLSVQCLVGPCVPASVVCTANAECDDGNACTVDACSPADSAADALGCLHADIPPSACDDANPCTADACDAGAGCIHNPIAGCNVGTSECSGKPDLTPCGTPAGNCRLACRSEQCASQLVCEQTSATQAPNAAPAIAVVCRSTDAGPNEFCETQGFAAKPVGQAIRPALVSPPGLRKVTKKVRRGIDPGTGLVSFQLGLNKYGKRLLKKARKKGRSLPVTVVIEVGSDTGSSLLTQTVTLAPS